MAEGSVNGVVYQFVHIKVTLPSGLPQFLRSIEYEESVDGEVITKTNGLPGGYGEGKWEGSCKMEMGKSDMDLLRAEGVAFGGIFNMPPIPVIVSYGDPVTGQKIQVDTLEVKLNKFTNSNSDGDKELKRGAEGVLTQPIKYDGAPSITRS